jgi:hypothetical protein
MNVLSVSIEGMSNKLNMLARVVRESEPKTGICRRKKYDLDG